MPDRNSLFYPDVTLVKGPVEFRDKEQDVVTNPTVVIHITSRSREFFDRRERIEAYVETTSLSEILLISEDHTAVEVYRRKPEGFWFQGVPASRRANLRIRAIEVEIPISTIYEGVDY